MKTFECCYSSAEESHIADSHSEIEAENPEGAAAIFAELFPERHPKIAVGNSYGGHQYLPNPNCIRTEEELAMERINSLQKLHSSVESADGNLAGLSYIELSALIENLKDFPVMRDKIGPEECAVREELYKVAFFDRNLQTELQVELLRDLKSAFTDLQSGKSGSGAGKSNLARNAAMVGGLAALQKLHQIEENTADVSEGFGVD